MGRLGVSADPKVQDILDLVAAKELLVWRVIALLAFLATLTSAVVAVLSYLNNS